MHRNAEIWEKRHERVTKIGRHAEEQLRQASIGAMNTEDATAVAVRRTVVLERCRDVESRVWNALCVAKGWRKK